MADNCCPISPDSVDNFEECTDSLNVIDIGANLDDDVEEYHSADDDGDDKQRVCYEEQQQIVENTLSDAEIEARLSQAKCLKEEGNLHFKNEKYREAIKVYKQSLHICPLKFAKDRSIMYSNRAACNMRLELYDTAIKDSSRALELNPVYLKALLRRAELYEKTEKLDEALVDYQKVLELDPSQHSARAACLRLPDQIKERNEKLKEEMMGKLKDLGNMVLKPFGLSTSNFQMVQDPDTGSYSIKYNQNGH